jgi:hypothetical protein
MSAFDGGLGGADAVEGPAALDAYRKFLTGGQLGE